MISGKTETISGLVLGYSQYGDSSLIVSFASDNGLVSLLARGIYKPKSPLKPFLVVGSYLKCDCKVTEKNLYLPSSVLVIKDASLAMTDYVSSCFLMFLSEVSLAFYRYGDQYPYEDVSLIIQALIQKGDPLSLALLLMGTFYKSLGLKEDTDGCFNCGTTKQIVSYSLEDGGYICKDCNQAFNKPTKSELQLYVFKFAFMDLNEKTLSKIVPSKEGKFLLEDLLNNLISYFDLHPIKSLSLFLKALNG
ncbi:MAG: DNA repair protein RecO [Bacilli bacterium]